MTGPPSRFYIHFVGGKLYANPERFIREAKRLGVARAIPKEWVKGLSWGATILLATWKVHDSDKALRAGRKGVATVFGYFNLTGLNVVYPNQEVKERLHARLKIEETRVEAHKVERECGSYVVVEVSSTKETVYRIIDQIQILERETGEHIRVFMTGGFQGIDPRVTLDPIGFTRSIAVAFIQTDKYAPFVEPPEMKELAWVMDYSARRYVKRSERERLDRETGWIAGAVTP